MRRGTCIGVTALALALLAGNMLLGDDKKPDEPPKVKGQLPAHFKKLGLSDKQVADIYKIEGTYHDKIRALVVQLEDLRKAERMEVDGVLTDEQKTHLKEILTSEVVEKDKPAPSDKDKPVTPPEKDKPVLIDKDKGPPARDKDKDK